MTRKAAKPIEALSVAARALGIGAPIDLPTLPTLELAQVGAAISKSAEVLQQRSAERDRFEANLRESERRVTFANLQLQTIADRMAVAVTRCSRDLNYLWVSKQYADWIGRDYRDIAGKPIVEVIGERGLESIFPYIKRALQGEEVQYEAERNFERIGKRWISAIYRPTAGSRFLSISLRESASRTPC